MSSAHEAPEILKKKRNRAERAAHVSDDSPVLKKKKRKEREQSQLSSHQDMFIVPPPACAGDAYSSIVQDSDPQATTISFLSAIVAAATQQNLSYQPSDALTPNQNLNPGTSNDLVMQALHAIGIEKIANALKSFDTAQAAQFSGSTNFHGSAPVPSVPVGQVPASSNVILQNATIEREKEEVEALPPSHTQTASQPEQFTRSDHSHILATKWLNTNKLAAMVVREGLVYKKGKFSATEEQQVRAAIENYRVTRQLTQEQLDAVIFPKNDKEKDNAFWTEITYAVPQRPIVAVYHHVRRVYHPIKVQGKWMPSEDDRLREAVANLGQQWEKVSELVGRRAADCRDRYRNHILNRDARVSGVWSKEEESNLTRIVTEMTVLQGKSMDNDVFWGTVSAQMGGARSRQQCRIKWTDSLSKAYKSDGKMPRWSNRDAYILVRKIESLNVNDDSEIDWKTLSDPNWNLWSAHVLQRRWLTMKRSIKGFEEMPHQELVDILKAKKAEFTTPTEKDNQKDEETGSEEPSCDQGKPSCSE